MSIQLPKILCLFSAPLVAPDGNPLDALDLTKERDAIVQELSVCKKEILLRIGYATIGELAASIAEGFNILHLSAHGFEEYLLFEDGEGGSLPVTGDYLKRFICMGGPFELAVVSACHSGRIGEILAEAGIRHVVAIRCDVPLLDHAAIIFVGQFFRSLFRGDSVQKAFEMAKLMVEGNPDLMKLKRHLGARACRKELLVPEEKKFVLLPEGSTAHSAPLISQEVPQGVLVVEEPLPSTSNLPVRPQSFTGRSVEMHDIIGEMLLHRLVTITGVGGVGKTMLAIEVARWFCARNQFPDGVLYIDLRQIDTAEGIIDVLGATIGVQLDELEDVLTFMRERHCLLLLDNAEDILWLNENAVQGVIHAILKFTSNTRLLITSQRPIGGNLYEPERIYRVLPLEQADAAFLFLATSKRRILRKEWESRHFSSLLEYLGGHPLSIVLTASQLVPGIVLEDLMERIQLYRGRAIKVKHITERDLCHGESLVASLASAYDQLSDNARTLFGILSLLPAGAQEEMLTEVFKNAAWEYVQELNEASLLEIKDRRAVLLPPVRLFAMSVTTDNIREYYGPKIVEFLAVYTKKLYDHHGTKNAKEYRFYFTQDEPNLRSAVDLPCYPPQTAKECSALGLVGPRLIFLYIFHNRLREAKEIGDRILLNLKKLQDSLGEADTLLIQGILAMRLGNLKESRLKFETALEIYQGIGHRRGEANTFWELGELAVLCGDLEGARSRYETALAVYQDMDEKLGEAHVFMHLGELLMLSGDLEAAKSRHETALNLYRKIDEKVGEANTLKNLGDLAIFSGDYEEARLKYETALNIYQEIDEKDGRASTLIRLGQWAVFTDRFQNAETYLGSASSLCAETDNLEGHADNHRVNALAFLKQQNAASAQYELDCCSSIQNKICAHGKVAHWLILYAAHLKSLKLEDGAKMCLEYAKEFASKTRNRHLQNQVNQLIEAVQPG
ncbi:MAG: tetratricopeptide repeat protein [Theionarchaea archaeon]|nr:tetratricopeptide repeat protein [Theionarchaea archaeon]